MSILNFKPFYIHRCRNRTRRDSHRMQNTPRGFTVLVEPSGNERTLTIRLAMCNYKDEFSKKEGRLFANSVEEAQEINARDLPIYLTKLTGRIYGMNPNRIVGEYDYVMRYVV